MASITQKAGWIVFRIIIHILAFLITLVRIVIARSGDHFAASALMSLTIYIIFCALFPIRKKPANLVQDIATLKTQAITGDAMAQNSLAVAYSKGDGVPKDYTEAVIWCRRSAEQGNIDAQYNLGLLYFKGEGVPQDYSEAYFWLSLANAFALASNTAKMRDEAAARLIPSELIRVQEQTRKWFEVHPPQAQKLSSNREKAGQSQ